MTDGMGNDNTHCRYDTDGRISSNGFEPVGVLLNLDDAHGDGLIAISNNNASFTYSYSSLPMAMPRRDWRRALHKTIVFIYDQWLR